MKLSVTSGDKFQSRQNSPVTPDTFPQNCAHLADERLEIVVSRSGKRPNLASLRSQLVLYIYYVKNYLAGTYTLPYDNALKRHRDVNIITQPFNSLSRLTFITISLLIKLIA